MRAEVLMTDYRAGGRRRIDKVLNPSYLDSISSMSEAKLRRKEHEAQLEELDLAAVRAMLQARIDVIGAEQHRRERGESRPHDFAYALAQTRRGVVRFLAENLGLARLLGVPAAHMSWRQRRVERLIHDVDLSDVDRRTDDELARVRKTFEDEEVHVIEVHDKVAAVVNRCRAELAARYASSSDLGRSSSQV